MPVTKENYHKLIDHRLEKFSELQRGRITMHLFSNKNYQFVRQFRLKPVPKAHDQDSLIYNYVYWMIHIERKICIERQLMEASLNNIISRESSGREKLMYLIRFYCKRRNQAVQRLIREAKMSIDSATLIFDDIVELEMSFPDKIDNKGNVLEKGKKVPFLFYCNKSVLDAFKNIDLDFGLSKHQTYVSLLNLNISLNLEKIQ